MMNLFKPGCRRRGLSWQRRPACRTASLASSSRPGLETLEDRLVPAHIFVHTFTDGPSLPIPASHMAPNLRSAVDHSGAGDEIDLDSGVYTLASQLLVGHDLLIRNGAGAPSTIDARHHNRVFEIGGGASVALAGLIVTGGIGSGTGQGGGIAVDRGAALTLNNDAITDNSVAGAPAQGGGIYNLGSLTINNSVISGNRASGTGEVANAVAQGGGIYSAGPVSLFNSTLSGNSAVGGFFYGGFEGAGGGLFLAPFPNPARVSPVAVITGTSFVNNQAGGGSNYSNYDFLSGGGGGRGGGLYQDSNAGPVAILGSAFFGNRAEGGGNSGSGTGGGLFQNAGAASLSLLNSTFAMNVAAGGGNLGGGPGGSGSGGGLWLGGKGPPKGRRQSQGPTDLLVSDTIVRNSAEGGYGRYAMYGSGSGGGLVFSNNPGATPPHVGNTLIAGNVADGFFHFGSGHSPAPPDVQGSFVSLGHNLVGVTMGSTGFSAARGDRLDFPASQIGLG